MKGNKNKKNSALKKSLISKEELDSGVDSHVIELKPGDQTEDQTEGQADDQANSVSRTSLDLEQGVEVDFEQEETKQDDYNYFDDDGETIEIESSGFGAGAGAGDKLDSKKGNSQDQMFSNINPDLGQALVQVDKSNNLSKLQEACGYIYKNLRVTIALTCSLSTHVAFMYYLLTEYSGKQIMDKDNGIKLLTDLSPKWQRSIKDSFIILTVFANFALSIYSLSRALSSNKPEANNSNKKSCSSSILGSSSAVVLALLFVASCDESIRSFEQDNPNLNTIFKLDMKAAAISVLVVYTLLFYPDLQPTYQNIGRAVRDSAQLNLCGVHKDIKNSYRDFLIKQRVEYLFKKTAMRYKNTGDFPNKIEANNLRSQVQYLKHNSKNIIALMCHRSIFLHHLAAGVLTYFDIGLLLGSVSAVKNGISELINMVSGLEVNLKGENGKFLEYFIFSMVVVAVPVFVDFGVQGAKVGALFAGNMGNTKALAFGLSMLSSTVLFPRIFSEMTSNNLAQLLLSVLAMAFIQAIAERSNFVPKDLLRQYAVMPLVMLSGMAFFATTYISEMAAQAATSAAESHPFDQASAAMFSPFHPFLIAFVGFMMAGAFNTNPVDKILHGALNKITDDLILKEINSIQDYIDQNNGVVVQGTQNNPLNSIQGNDDSSLTASNSDSAEENRAKVIYEAFKSYHDSFNPYQSNNADDKHDKDENDDYDLSNSPDISVL